MSALGQKQTYAVHQPMSALPPIATAIAFLGGKWLELLKQVAPNVARVAVLRDSTLSVAMSLFAAIQAMAPSLQMEVIPLNMRNSGDIEQSIESFARLPNGGVIP